VHGPVAAAVGDVERVAACSGVVGVEVTARAGGVMAAPGVGW
jgi:hypothetical protein